MACSNPKTINNGVVNDFGFTTVFNPYLKNVTFDTTDLSTFTSTSGVYATFEITDPNGNVVGGLDYGASSHSIAIATTRTLSITLVSTGVLFFGSYTVTGRIWKNASVYDDITFSVNVCWDGKLENNNSAKGCITVDTNCATAKLTVKEQTNFKYNGLTPVSKTYEGLLTYPDNYIDQKEYAYIPFEQSLDGSITGLYQVKTTTTARYEMDYCYTYLDIPYISKWANDVECAGTLSTLMCCWTKSLEIVYRGGSAGELMQDKMQEAAPIFNMALLQEFNGKNSYATVLELQKLLGCDCKCQKGLTIQANPITYGSKNLVGVCGTSVQEDDTTIEISSYNIVIDACDSDDGFDFELTTSECNKSWCMTVDFSVVQQNILDMIASDSDYISQWQEVLGVSTCPCKASVIWLSQNGASPSSSNILSFSQITVCGGNVITFPSVQTANSLSSLVTYLNAHIKYLAGTWSYVSSGGSNLFSLTSDGTGIVTSFVPTDGACTIVVYLYTGCSTVAIVNGVPLIIDVERLSDYYIVHNVKYFTKSDTIETITLQDQSTITGGILGTITISETTTGGSATISTLLDDYDLDASSVCGRDLVAMTGTITQSTETSTGCTAVQNHNTSYARVAKSERWQAAYRANPQINDLPYYSDYIYRNDVLVRNSSGIDGASCIRVYNTVTEEVFQIAGVTNLATRPNTLNNVWGDVVEYYYPSSVYVDRNEITNGHPAVYFCTFGGVFCKLIRERTTECDERANWKNYILAGDDDGSTHSLPTTGDLARFTSPYGIKRLGTVNSQPSFVIIHSNTFNLISYDGSGAVTSSSNWNVALINVAALNNFNIDRETVVISSVTYTSIPIIYSFGYGQIERWAYKGSETSATDLVDATKYVNIDTIINHSQGSVDGYTSVAGTKIHDPIFLSKITYDGYTTYVFSEEYVGAIPAGTMKLRGFRYIDAELGYEIITVVGDNGGNISKFGNNSVGNPFSEGMFWHPVKARYYEYPFFGGIRKLSAQNSTQAIVTGTTGGTNYILYAEESGAASLVATEQDLSTGVVDTNYELIIS